MLPGADRFSVPCNPDDPSYITPEEVAAIRPFILAVLRDSDIFIHEEPIVTGVLLAMLHPQPVDMDGRHNKLQERIHWALRHLVNDGILVSEYVSIPMPKGWTFDHYVIHPMMFRIKDPLYRLAAL